MQRIWKIGRKIIDATSVAGNVRFKPNYDRDIFLVSFPRSGNTWMRSVIFHILSGEPAKTLREIDYVVPDIHHKIRKREMKKLDFYVIKSHEPLRYLCSSARYKKVIYLVRDPRNVGLSYHRYIENRTGTKIPLDKFLEDYFVGHYWPCSWGEHVRSWLSLEPTSERDIIYVRYEDLARGDLNSFADIVNFTGINSVSLNLTEILKHHSLEVMSGRERRGNRPSIETGSQYFIGEGKSEAPTDELSQDMFYRFQSINADVLERFGYA